MLAFTVFTYLLYCAQSITNAHVLTQRMHIQLEAESLISNLHSDPEIYQNITQVIRYHGYPCEDHTVVTHDGYILSIQRIPYGRKHTTKASRPVVFLQHGLLDSAHTWVNNLPSESLGFMLADAGYDVWLGNSRGNTYSRRHVSLDPNKEKFWDFSWDEMAHFDLPAVIDYLLNVTKVVKISYVGHSQGTEIAFAKFSSDQALASKISSFVALGPVATVGYMRSPVRYLAPFTSTIAKAIDLFGHGEFLPTDKLLKFLGRYLCGHFFSKVICSDIIFMIAGYDKKNMNETRLPVYIAHTPAGTSARNMVHYSQAIENHKFQMFNFGREENIARYGQPTPPLYNVSNLHVPTALFWGGQDWLADAEDVKLLIPQLRNLVHNRYIDSYNHMDFVWGVNAHTVIYPDVIKVLRNYTLT